MTTIHPPIMLSDSGSQCLGPFPAGTGPDVGYILDRSHLLSLHSTFYIFTMRTTFIYENCLKKRKVVLFVSFSAINHSVDLEDPGGCKPHFNGLLT